MVDKYRWGKVVKSKKRETAYPLFLLLLEYPQSTGFDQFTATPIFNKEPGPEENWDRQNDIGRFKTGWKTEDFDESSWQEVNEWLK